MADLKSTKGKPSKIQKKFPIDGGDDSDDSSSINSEDDKMNDSDDEDGENDDDDDVEQMSNKEARQMLDDEVFFPFSSIHLGSETISPSCPGLLMIQLRCSTTMMTLKSPLPSLLAAGGPARFHDPRHQNPKECLTIKVIQAKRRLMMTSLGKLLCLLEDLIGRNLAR
jgi:hypothetical protein